MDVYSAVIGAINDHLKAQPYEMTCAECGCAMDHTKRIDDDGDIFVTVKPCSCGKQSERE